MISPLDGKTLQKAANLSTIEVITKSSCGGNTVPKRKRVQREHTEDWQTIQQYTLWPEQTAYELLRPMVDQIPEPAERRLAAIRLHSEGRPNHSNVEKTHTGTTWG